jgi:hypothetical protein
MSRPQFLREYKLVVVGGGGKHKQRKRAITNHSPKAEIAKMKKISRRRKI